MKTTRIVFRNEDISRKNLMMDINLESLDDVELQELWTQHGNHARSWEWERVHTGISAPTWDWEPFTDSDDIKSVRREIAEVEAMPATQMYNRELIEYNLECLKAGLQAFEKGEKVWINRDDDGIHLAIQES